MELAHIHSPFSYFRLSLWMKETDGAKLTVKPPQLRSLPPTNQALELDIKRVHYQAMMWHRFVGHPSSEDLCEVPMILLTSKK